MLAIKKANKPSFVYNPLFADFDSMEQIKRDTSKIRIRQNTDENKGSDDGRTSIKKAPVAKIIRQLMNDK